MYRYDDELIIKAYNQNNTCRDVEQAIAMARKVFYENKKARGRE